MRLGDRHRSPSVTESEWAELRLATPVGSTVHATVTQHARFGFFLDLEEHSAANAVVLAPDFDHFASEQASPTAFPPVGSRVQAEVRHHVEPTMQIRCQLGRHNVTAPR